MRSLIAMIITLGAVPTMAHPGAANLHWHFFEHLMLALVIGVPAVYVIARLIKSRFKAG